MIALLLFALLLAVLIGACVEFHWLRQTVLKRSDRLTAELHTVEAVLAEHREALADLKSGSEASDAAYTAFFRSMESSLADFQKDCKQRYGNLNSSVLNICRGLSNMGGDVVRIREIQKGLENQDVVFANSFAQVQKAQECLDRMENFQIQYGRMLEKVSAVVCQPADTASDPDRDIQLSKSMEEGIMNLMQYAAGKTSGGVEVGLG